MPDLDAIHYKFFPKAKTAPWGKKLIVMAWIIEILVASVSFAIAMLFFFINNKKLIFFTSADNIDTLNMTVNRPILAENCVRTTDPSTIADVLNGATTAICLLPRNCRESLGISIPQDIPTERFLPIIEESLEKQKFDRQLFFKK